MLMYRLGLCLVLISLILVHRPVRAEWLMIDNRYQSPGLQTVYVDPGSIRREGNLVTISALIDWTWMQGNRSPTRFYSTKLTKQIDCAEMRVRTLAATDYYGHMGTGEVIGGGGHTSESHWVPIESGTLNHEFWEAACGKG